MDMQRVVNMIGEYKAHNDTPLWISEYGISSGIAIVDLLYIGEFHLEQRD